MQQYDKDEIKKKLDTDMVFDMVNDFGGDPRMTNFGFISATICHNERGEGSHKLYYYENDNGGGGLFRCYTGCNDTFDIFELITRVNKIARPNLKWDLYDSVRWVASRYGWAPSLESAEQNVPQLADWHILDRYSKLREIIYEPIVPTILKEYNSKILKHLSYPIIYDWEREGITREVMQECQIGYYPVDEQITIPHFDIQGRLVGLRGRALGQEQAQLFGKYKPIQIGKQWYNHPLGFNLYNIDKSWENIQRLKKAIIFEGEKGPLTFRSYFGKEQDISVACCGSSISAAQMQILLDLNVNEITIAFDKQFQEKNDNEFNHLIKNFKSLEARYGKLVTISFMFDKEDKLPYKASPIDEGSELFLEMYKNRIIL